MMLTPGTCMAVCHLPLTSLSTNAVPMGAVSMLPTALQLPGDAHDTASTVPLLPWLRAALPGTSTAVRQVPLTSLTTNASLWSELLVYSPTALQLPGDVHDIELPPASPY